MNSVKVQCVSCGKKQESTNTRHIIKEQRQMSRGDMSVLLIPASECPICKPMIKLATA